MQYTEEEVIAHAQRICNHPRPLVSPGFRDIEYMAEGHIVDDGWGGDLRDKYYPGKPDSYFKAVIAEVHRINELGTASLK